MLTEQQFNTYIAALRSGTYTKGTEIRYGSAFNGLGVLFDSLGATWIDDIPYFGGVPVPSLTVLIASIPPGFLLRFNYALEIPFEKLADYLEAKKSYFVS